MENNRLVLLAVMCLAWGVSPAELDSLARQLAEFDAIADAQTGAHPCSQ